MEKPPVKTKEQCDALCPKAMLDYAKDLCSENKFCVDSLIDAKALGCDVEEPVDFPHPEEVTVDPEETNEPCEITDKYGVPCPTKPTPPKNGPDADDFMKAINTIKVIAGNLGGQVPDISGNTME